MKIGILTSYFWQEISEIHGKDRIIFGGAEKYLYELCKFLQSEGHSISVYQPITIPKGIDHKTVPAQIRKEYKGIPIICLPHLNNWTGAGVNPELNQFFNEAANYYDIAVFFVTFLAYPNVPKNSISISHGIYWDHPYSSYALASGEGKQEYLRQHLYGFEAPAVCVAVDSNVKRVIQAIKPGAESNIRVIANFVDCEKFKPVEKTWEGIRVLYPRRLSILRGQNEFIRATQLHPEYQYLAVGQATREDTEKKAADWAKTLPHLKFIHKEMDGMEEVYQQSDIAVVPTKACEGLSLSLLESMACGLPVITTQAGGIGDAVIDGYNAMIFDPASDNLADYIHCLAQNEQMRKVLGERNREIAHCFDIKVWHEKWRQIIDNFDTPHGIAERMRPRKLVAMMLVKNEADRYLRRVIENTLEFADEIAVLDDHSTDASVKICEEYAPRVKIKQAENTWEDESKLRKELLDFAATLSPDWLIAVDADELFEPDIKEHIRGMMKSQKHYWYAFRFYDMWDDEEHYRYDEHFKSGSVYAPRMFKYMPGMEYKWKDKNRHCGSIPENVLGLQGGNSAFRVKHLGYVAPADRQRKRAEKIADDPEFKFYPKETYDSITADDVPKVAWSDTNKWTAPGLTIAYPPDMEWGIMQQRPHHLLKLAAQDGNRVFFGDHTATGIYEVMHNVTLVNDWAKMPNKNPDILYVTSPGQLQHCTGMSPKKIVYDCCDYRGGADKELIQKADYLFVASKELLKAAHSLGRQDAVYLPNACDYEAFANDNGARKDIVCYMGIIASVLDFDLINSLSDFKICLVGQNKTSNKLPGQNLGHQPYANLPSILSQVKVGVIPFKLNGKYEQYSAPIKVYEYLAAGLPVVASPIPELKPLADKGLIHLVPTEDIKGWRKTIKKAFSEYPNIKGKEWAKTQTWENRWSEFKNTIERGC